MVSFYQFEENIFSLTALSGYADAQQWFCDFTVMLKLSVSGRRAVELPPLYSCTKMEKKNKNVHLCQTNLSE